MREANEKQREQLRVVEKELRDKTREVELVRFNTKVHFSCQ